MTQAKQAVAAGNLATGYNCLLSARRETIWGYTPGQIKAARLALQQEIADDKISGWRRNAITALIGEMGKDDTHLLLPIASLAMNATGIADIQAIMREEGGEKQTQIANYLQRTGADANSARAIAALIVQVSGTAPTVAGLVQAISGLLHDPTGDWVLLHEAIGIRDEGYQNTYRKIERLQWQLLTLGLALVAVVGGIFVLASQAPLALKATNSFGSRILAYVGLFGALGGCLSAIQSLSKGGSSLRIPEQLVQGATTFVRPLFGAAAAIAVYAFLQSGLITVQSNSNASVLAASFVAGFTERFVVYAAGLVSKQRSSSG
jgi:hypothetical protein